MIGGLARTALVAIALSMLVGPALAQDAPAPRDIQLQNYGDDSNAKLYSYDAAVPAAPALALVQGAPELSVSSPFGPDLSTEFVTTGDKPGLAVAARPFWLSDRGRTISFKAYRDAGFLRQAWARATVSLAAAPVTAGVVDDGFGVALGVHTELLSTADPRFNTAHTDCLKRVQIAYLRTRAIGDEASDNDPAVLAEARLVVRSYLPAAPAAVVKAIDDARSVDDLVDVVQDNVPGQSATFMAWINVKRQAAAATAPGAAEGLKALTAVCFKRAGLAAENAASFQVAAGVSGHAPTYGFSDLSYSGASVWAAYRWPLGRYRACADTAVKEVTDLSSATAEERDKVPRDQQCLPPAGNLTLFAQSTTDGQVTVAGAEHKAAVTQAGLVLSRKARNNNWNLAASAVWVQRDFDAATLKTQDFTRYGLTYAHKVKEGVWFEASFGETRGMPTDEESYGLVRITFK